MLNAFKIYFLLNVSPSNTQFPYRRCVCSLLHSRRIDNTKQILCCALPNSKNRPCCNNFPTTTKFSHLTCACFAKKGDKSSNDKTEMASNAVDLDDSDDEIAIVGEFNALQERAKRAIEIVLDDDGDEPQPSTAQVPSPPTENAGNHFSNTSAPSTAASSAAASSTAQTSSHPPAFPTVNNDAEVGMVRDLIEQYRPWELTNLGAGMRENTHQFKDVTFCFLSYNVLAQQLLDTHFHLYQRNDPRALGWEHRSHILLKELAIINADIICLQEVQEDHLQSFYNRLNGLGYKGLYKKRTGGKKDGLAIYFRKSRFTLEDHCSVEFYQPGVELLNRDNVGLLAKLTLKGTHGNKRQLVVANTHLLYNPRREDVRLGQTQLLLAEIDRMAFYGEDRRTRRPLYIPVILAGDFNTQPGSEVHRLLSESCVRYEGAPIGKKGSTLTRTLLPRQLEVTDTCQHFSVICRRPDMEKSEDQRSRLMIYHSEQNRWGSFRQYVDEMHRRGLVNTFTPRPHIEIPIHRRTLPPAKLPPDGFSTGLLSHNLNLRSVYRAAGRSGNDVTTFQDGWGTVDYIFYGGRYMEDQDCIVEGELKVVSRLRLPRAVEAEYIGPIPNLAMPSDHYPLAAIFTFK